MTDDDTSWTSGIKFQRKRNIEKSKKEKKEKSAEPESKVTPHQAS